MKPLREQIGTILEDTRESHPAYGMILAARVQGGARLAGSDFKHQSYIAIEVRHAHLSRSLSNDRWHGDKHIIRLSLSEAQWATFVSSMNVGFGVPCTLKWTEKDGRIDENGTRHGLERKVTKARTIPELYAYFSHRPKPRAVRDDGQADLYDEAERLTAEQERHEQND